MLAKRQGLGLKPLNTSSQVGGWGANFVIYTRRYRDSAGEVVPKCNYSHTAVCCNPGFEALLYRPVALFVSQVCLTHVCRNYKISTLK
jgi:hypothetical protein